MAHQFSLCDIMIIEPDDQVYRWLKNALKQVSTQIEPCYLPGCDYPYLGTGFYTPDLIFLNSNIPKTGGHTDSLACLKIIRESGYSQVPVVAYSTGVNDRHMEKAYEGGASLFLVLPENMEALLAVLRHLLQLDWKNPEHITSHYYRDGKAISFEATLSLQNGQSAIDSW